MGRTAKPLIAALLALLGASAHAGYAQAVPPPGFTTGPSGGEMGRFGYAKAANEAWSSGTVRTTASLNVGGRTVTMPAAMRFASNAPRFAAMAIYSHPLVRTGLTIATVLSAAKIMWDESQGKWVKVIEGESEIPDGYLYSVDSYSFWEASPQAACNSFVSRLNSTNTDPKTVFSLESFTSSSCRVRSTTTYSPPYPPAVGFTNHDINRKVSDCPAGWEVTPAGCRIKTATLNPINTPEEFADAVAPRISPLPDKLPEELPPGTPLPVDPPVINPAPGPLPQTPAAPRPWFVPQGDPVPNPNYNPSAPTSPENQPYIRPGVNIRPSPTLDEPWRVDLQPVDRPQTNPEPVPDDQLNPEPNPDNPDNPTNDQPKPEDQQSLCEKHPDIVACAKMDEVEPEDVQNEQKDLSITPSAGWESGAATCPAPVTRQVAGLTLEMQWQPFCDLATGIRPVILALAWVAAAMMVIGVARRGE